MPLVSIIMNVRNGAAYLREAMNSVFAQSFSDWELIVWDDCSTDNSALIIAEYRDPRVRYFLSPEDTPLGKARDSAIREAKGEWLAFLDQDDIWLPSKLERQLALTGPGVAIVYGRTVLFDTNHGDFRDYDTAHEFGLLPEGNIFGQLFRNGCFIAMSSALLRRSAVQELGGIPDYIQVIPDYFLYLGVAHRHQARAVQEVVCRYRVHAGSMTRTNRRRLYEEPLLLMDQWEGGVDSKLLAHRRRIYATGLAFEEMRSLNSFPAGAARLLSRGSWSWLLSRPLIRLWRGIRRKLRRPQPGLA